MKDLKFGVLIFSVRKYYEILNISNIQFILDVLFNILKCLCQRPYFLGYSLLKLTQTFTLTQG